MPKACSRATKSRRLEVWMPRWPVWNAVVVGAGRLEEELRAEAVRRRPVGERGGRGDQLLVGGGQAQDVPAQGVEVALLREVVDADRCARAGEPLFSEGGGDPRRDARRRAGRGEQHQGKDQAHEDDEHASPGALGSSHLTCLPRPRLPADLAEVTLSSGRAGFTRGARRGGGGVGDRFGGVVAWRTGAEGPRRRGAM